MMLRLQALVRGVEVGEVAAADVDRADAQPHRPAFEQLEIDQLL
jgi:hypothetical protein